MSCLACGSDALQHVYTLRGKGNARIVRCDHCSLTQLDPLPSARELESLYVEGYFEGGENDGGYEEYAQQEREYLATFDDDVRRILQFARGRRVPTRTPPSLPRIFRA